MGPSTSSSPIDPSGASWLWLSETTTQLAEATDFPIAPDLKLCTSVYTVQQTQHSAGPYAFTVSTLPDHASQSDNRTCSPPMTSTLSVGTTLGLSSRATDGVSSAQLTPRELITLAIPLCLSSSDGTHTQPPKTSVVTISVMQASNVYDANCRARVWLVNLKASPWPRQLVETARCSSTTPFG